MRLVNAFLRRSPAERWLILRALGLVVLVRLGLWVLPYKRVRHLAARAPAGSTPRYSVDTIVRTVVAVSRRVPAASCLTQALTAQRLLAREGYASEMQIGVARNEEGSFEAHAWLERDGRIVIGDQPGLTRFTKLPSKRAS
jgi:hypothetical protein